MPRVEVASGCIHYDVAGEGNSVAFISGLGGKAAFWDEQIREFARRFRIVTYDHRGIGRSAGAPPYTVVQWADDLLAVLDDAGIGRAHVVGHSTGGIIAQTLSTMHPERVETLVLSGTWLRPDQRFRDLFELRKQVLLMLGENAYRTLGELLASPGPIEGWSASKEAPISDDQRQIVLGRIDALLGFGGIASAADIATPALVLASDDDYIVPGYLSEILAAEIRSARLVRFASGGHFFPKTRARDYNDVILNFWNEVRRR